MGRPALDILIVDDGASLDPLLADALRSLTVAGRILRASPPEAAATAAAQAGDLGVIVLDLPIDPSPIVAALRARHGVLATLPILVATLEADRAARRAALAAGATDILDKPFEPDEVRARVATALALALARREQASRSLRLAREVAAAVALVEAREREIVTRLVRAAEHRDKGTGDHLQRVAAHAEMMALRLGTGPSWARQLALASTMHDVGKIAVPDAILLKKGPLTPVERTEIAKHTEHGFAILAGSQSEVIQLAAEISISHHERWDGAGYPRGIAGAAIPLAGRIVAVADVFDALLSERSYKTSWPLAQAKAYVAAEAGRHFDPRCVEVFLAGLADGENLSAA